MRIEGATVPLGDALIKPETIRWGSAYISGEISCINSLSSRIEDILLSLSASGQQHVSTRAYAVDRGSKLHPTRHQWGDAHPTCSKRDASDAWR